MEYLFIAILLSFSALFSGLTLGFLGLDKSELERKRKLGNPKAEAVYQVRKNNNLLLVTLLVGNVLVNAVLSVLLASFTTGFVAVAVSTFLIVIFGEIVPQAFFAKYALDVGYYFVPVVRLLLFLFYPVAAPIAWVLEQVMGAEEDTIWSKEELSEIIKDHEDSKDSELDSDEEKVLLGALTYSDKKAGEVMTHKDDCYLLSEGTLLTESVLRNIKEMGFTRVPVYYKKRRNIVGVLFTKDLITLQETKPLAEVYRPETILQARTDEALDDLLNRFIRKKMHMAYVVNTEGGFAGLVTLEDIVEEIINTEIEDETDGDEWTT